MSRIQGIGGSPGIAIGRVHLLTPRLVVVDRRVAKALIPGEVARLQAAIIATDSQLAQLEKHLEATGQRESQLVLGAHRMMLKSPELGHSARALVQTQGLAAESAVRRTVDRISAVFDKVRDPYLRERGGDVDAVGERLLAVLLGLAPASDTPPDLSGQIGVGTTLSPIEAVNLGRSKIAGLLIERGGPTSHASLIVRDLGIPYVFGWQAIVGQLRQGGSLVIDGGAGEAVLDPDLETLAEFKQRKRALEIRLAWRRREAKEPARTLDGGTMALGANISALDDLEAAVECGAESVGLFRTELLYLNRQDLPSEEEQFKDAVDALTRSGGREVTFRTLDVGGDKLPPSLELPPCANPSLGVRGVRFSLHRPDIFRSQLRALYRASAHGKMRVMFPLVAGIGELKAAVALCQEVRLGLLAEGIPIAPHVPLGTLLETPSAVLTVDHLAAWCEFFSLGTNDLIQYAFAADRESLEVRPYCSPYHPALLRLIKHALDAAERAHRPISICGSLAGDPNFTVLLMGLGARSLSMSAGELLAVRAVIRRSRLDTARVAAERALALTTPEDVEADLLETQRAALAEFLDAAL